MHWRTKTGDQNPLRWGGVGKRGILARAAAALLAVALAVGLLPAVPFFAAGVVRIVTPDGVGVGHRTLVPGGSAGPFNIVLNNVDDSQSTVRWATVTAKAADGSNKSAACKVTVTRPVTGVTLDKASSTLTVGFRPGH
ncbi:MAG: hypothetical protein FWF71_03610 [Actinomycetia bacterium]|nr:hypothetical protein [Actinomycetes bacterium]